MKYTAWSTIGLGVAVAAYLALSHMITRTGGSGEPLPSLSFPGRIDTVALLLLAAAAVGAGVLMLAYGGRGYVRTTNPSVRN